MKFKHVANILIFLLICSCSPDSDTLDAQLDFEIANSMGDLCDFITPIPNGAPSVPNAQTIVVQGRSEAHIAEAIASLTPTKRSIFFPRGVYRIPLVTRPNGRLTPKTVLNFNQMSDIEIYGEQGTVFKLDYSQEDPDQVANMNARLITINNSNNIYIHDIDLKSTFNFNTQDGQDGYAKGHSNVFVRNSSNIYLYDLKSSDVPGDAINIGATQGGTTSQIHVKNVVMNNTNRNGITIGGKGFTEHVYVSECTFGNRFRSQQLDMEPLEHSQLSNIQIENNIFIKLKPSSNAGRQGAISTLSLEGNGINCVLIKNNIIRNDIVFARSCSNYVLEGNTEIPSMLIRNNSNNFSIVNNEFAINVAPTLDGDRKSSGITVAANPLPIGTSEVPYAEPSEIHFDSNDIFINSNITDVKYGISLRNTTDIMASSNNIQFTSPSARNIGVYTKFIKTNLPQQSTLDRMEFTHCDNDYDGITSQNRAIFIDTKSDANSVQITNCQ